jgi:hypothetical protein
MQTIKPTTWAGAIAAHHKKKNKVRVYFNLHRKQLSVQSKTDKGWRVWLHADKITLEDVEFKVSEAGRQRVLREKKKNVHAFIEGNLVLDGIKKIEPRTLVSYNPYLPIGKFYERKTNKVINRAEFVVIVGRQILAQK